MKNYCEGCEHQNTCETYKDCNGCVDFCYGCKDYWNCPIMEYCDEGHPIQCNNGYENNSYDYDR